MRKNEECGSRTSEQYGFRAQRIDAILFGEQDGAVVKTLASHQCGPGSIPGLDVIGGLSLLLVLYSAPRGFSPGTPVFPSPQKPTFPNSNSIRMQDLPENHFAVSGASWVNIVMKDKLHFNG